MDVGGVHVLGPVNLPSSTANHASQMYARNLQTLLGHVAKGGTLAVSLEDEIQKAMIVTHGGEVRAR